MIKAIIIDDEPLAHEIIKEYLQSWSNISVIADCNDGFEGVKAINWYNPDLVFLDIKMPKISGFEMLELVENMPSVIFTTAFDEFAVKAFDANAIDYLLKPFEKERFDKAIDKYFNILKNKDQTNNSLKLDEFINNFNNSNEEQNRIVVKTKYGIKILSLNDICFFEAYDDYVKINTKDECFLKKRTMSYYEKILEKQDFVRVHRSFIVSISQINRIENATKDSYNAILKNGKKIPLSRNGYSKLKVLLGL